MNHLDRIIIFPSTVGATFVALLLESFLSLGIGEAKQEFDPILAFNVMELTDDSFGILAGFKAKAGGR